MKAALNSITALAVACTFAWSANTFAQDNAWSGATGSWTDGPSWTLFDVPDPGADGQAIVGWNDPPTSGLASATGVVNVTTPISVTNPSPTVILGLGGGSSGTLNIAAGGNFSVVPGLGPSSGNLSVGLNGGVGILNVDGTLSVQNQLESLNIADGASTTTLSGSATVTAASGFMDRQLIIDGSNVNATFTNGLVLGGSGTHTWKIPATGASTLKVGGNADINGVLKVEFPSGTPSIGDTWNLIDSVTVDDGEFPSTKGFASIDQSAVSGLAIGTKFAVSSVSGGTNGTYTQLSLEQHPVLVIDRNTGAATIKNFNGSAATVDFDAYVLGSAGGYFNPGAWNSIDPNNGWVEAGSTNTTLTELNPINSESLAASTSISLGTPFTVPSTFGEENENVTFQFAKPDESTFTTGTVIYTGASNNTLTLNVDPNTGDAQLVNGTPFTVSIDTYVISSDTGSLDPNTGAWNSLEDQGTSGGNWFEANSDAQQLSELLVTGGLVLAPNSMIPIGSPFDDVSGTEDLEFQFALVGDESGDFDGDGDRDGADFLLWQTNPSIGDLADWEANYGIPTTPGSDDLLTGKVLYSDLVNLGGGSLAAVPEPSTAFLAVTCVSLIVGMRRRYISQKY